MPYKGKTSDELLTLRQASELEEYAGILNDDAVLVDIDDHEQSETLMQMVEDFQLGCRVYQTTRGKHFLFRNNGKAQKNWTKKALACGLTSDGKLGSRDRKSVV